MTRIIYQDNLKYIFIFIYFLFLYHTNGIYQKILIPSLLLEILPLLLLPLLLIFVFKKSIKYVGIGVFPLFILLAFILRLMIVKASPDPAIDIFVLLKEAPVKLLQGINPYNSTYTQVYSGTVTDNYTYWPYSIYLEMPFVLIFKDPRVILIIADILAGAGLFYMGGKTSTAKLFSLIYLFRPNSLYMIEQSFLTPIYTLLTYLFFYSILKFKPVITGISLAILSGIQPLYLMLIPLTVNLWLKKLRIISVFLLVFLLGVLPFYFWDKTSFIDKNILFYFKSTSELKTIPIHSSLNLNTAFFIITGKDLPFFLTFSMLAFIAGFLYFSRVFSEAKSFISKVSKQLLLTVIFFYLFYFLFRQSFIYYYYFAGNMLILWLTLAAREHKNA